MEAMHQSLEIMRTGKQEENPDFEEKIFNYGGNVVSKTVSEVGVFDMPNPYRYRYRYRYFSNCPYRYRYFQNFLIDIFIDIDMFKFFLSIFCRY